MACEKYVQYSVNTKFYIESLYMQSSWKYVLGNEFLEISSWKYALSNVVNCRVAKFYKILQLLSTLTQLVSFTVSHTSFLYQFEAPNSN